jgi:hypothetical protein
MVIFLSYTLRFSESEHKTSIIVQYIQISTHILRAPILLEQVSISPHLNWMLMNRTGVEGGPASKCWQLIFCDLFIVFIAGRHLGSHGVAHAHQPVPDVGNMLETPLCLSPNIVGSTALSIRNPTKAAVFIHFKIKAFRLLDSAV